MKKRNKKQITKKLKMAEFSLEMPTRHTHTNEYMLSEFA